MDSPASRAGPALDRPHARSRAHRLRRQRDRLHAQRLPCRLVPALQRLSLLGTCIRQGNRLWPHDAPGAAHVRQPEREQCGLHLGGRVGLILYYAVDLFPIQQEVEAGESFCAV